MISRFISTSLKLNRTTATSQFTISSINKNKQLFINTSNSNSRLFCTQNNNNNNNNNNVDSGDLEVEKLFQITQEITKELGEEEPIENQPIKKEDKGQLWGGDYPTVTDISEGDSMGFDELPTDLPLLPTNNAPTSIEDLIITYQDPFKDPFKSNDNYFPYFRFTEPRGYTVESFLKQIGRECDSHVELFEKWEDLMNTTPRKLKDLQVPVRNRKWICHWVEEFKQGRDPVLISKSKSIAKINKKK